jgi:hypothetical protein
MRALELRRRAQAAPADYPSSTAAVLAVRLQWQTYRECMCDATGCTAADIEAWLDRDLRAVTDTRAL